LGKTPADVLTNGPRYTGVSWSCIDIQVTAAGTEHSTAVLTVFCATEHYSKQQIDRGHVYTHNGTSLQPINTQMTQVFLTFQYHVSCTQTNTTNTSIASPKQCYMLQISHFLTSLRSMRDRQLQTDTTAQLRTVQNELITEMYVSTGTIKQKTQLTMQYTGDCWPRNTPRQSRVGSKTQTKLG